MEDDSRFVIPEECREFGEANCDERRRVPIHQRANLFVRESGEHVLRLFQLRNSRMLASGAAFHLRPRTGPMRVCVDGTNG